MAEPPALRVSDGEREAAVAHLREAAGEGRLTLEELTERVGLAYDARTEADLAALSADLPPAGPLASPRAEVEASAERDTDWVVAIMGGAARRGRWRLKARTNVVAIMGGADVDLREAELDGAEIEIVAVSVMGGIEVLVPDGVSVVMSGLAVMGSNDNRAPSESAPPGAPVVRVRAYSLMGAVEVKRRVLRSRLARHGHGLGHGLGPAPPPPRPPAPRQPRG